MRGLAKAVALLALALAALAALAWATGVVDWVLIERFIRRPAQQNLARQLATPEGTPGRRALDLRPFDAQLASLAPERVHELDALLEEATIPEIQEWMREGRLTAGDLALHALARIRTYDSMLSSVTELNPAAIEIARERDAERAAGATRGPLHGIPILLKDNIATGDALHTTAGARALEQARADRDAFLVGRLREAGAVLLGKTAMTEWANYMATDLPNGFSAVGGQVRNPYGRFDVSGSSSGSAVAVAAGLVPLAVGTETWGSLISPASQNSVVSIKPSLGLVSRDRIVPITAAQDTAGPIARNVIDAAILLDALAGADANDPVTQELARPTTPYASHATPGGLEGRRLGLVRLRWELTAGDAQILSRTIAALREGGATVVELPPISVLGLRRVADTFSSIADRDFPAGVDAYLRATRAPVQSLAEVIAFNAADPAARAPFGQDILTRALARAATGAATPALVAESRRRAREAIDPRLQRVDWLVAVGDAFFVSYCAAGYPALSVPAGYRESGEPVGLTLIGRFLDEPGLIRAAADFERIARARRPPPLSPPR